MTVHKEYDLDQSGDWVDQLFFVENDVNGREEVGISQKQLSHPATEPHLSGHTIEAPLLVGVCQYNSVMCFFFQYHWIN